MRKTAWAVVLAPALLLTDCSTVPVTGRNQLSIIPKSEMLGMSSAQAETALLELIAQQCIEKTGHASKIFYRASGR